MHVLTFACITSRMIVSETIADVITLLALKCYFFLVLFSFRLRKKEILISFFLITVACNCL